MTAIYIVCGILVFFLIVLLVPVGVDTHYRDVFKIRIKYAGITVFDSGKPKSEKISDGGDNGKKPDDIKKHKKKKKENFITRIFNEKGKIEGIKFLFSLIKTALSKIIFVLRKIKFNNFYLNIAVSSEDAAKTAVTYGTLCAAVYPVLNFVDQNTHLGIKKVNIYTDFDKISSQIEMSFSLRTRLIYAVIAAVSLLLSYLRIKKESDKNGRKQFKQPDGNSNR